VLLPAFIIAWPAHGLEITWGSVQDQILAGCPVDKCLVLARFQRDRHGFRAVP